MAFYNLLTPTTYGNAFAYQSTSFAGGQAVAYLNGFAVAPTGNLGKPSVVAYGGFNLGWPTRLSSGQVPAAIGRQGKRPVCFPLPPLHNGGWSYGFLT